MGCFLYGGFIRFAGLLRRMCTVQLYAWMNMKWCGCPPRRYVCVCVCHGRDTVSTLLDPLTACSVYLYVDGSWESFGHSMNKCRLYSAMGKSSVLRALRFLCSSAGFSLSFVCSPCVCAFASAHRCLAVPHRLRIVWFWAEIHGTKDYAATCITGSVLFTFKVLLV